MDSMYPRSSLAFFFLPHSCLTNNSPNKFHILPRRFPNIQHNEPPLTPLPLHLPNSSTNLLLAILFSAKELCTIILPQLTPPPGHTRRIQKWTTPFEKQICKNKMLGHTIGVTVRGDYFGVEFEENGIRGLSVRVASEGATDVKTFANAETCLKDERRGNANQRGAIADWFWKRWAGDWWMED